MLYEHAGNYRFVNIPVNFNAGLVEMEGNQRVTEIVGRSICSEEIPSPTHSKESRTCCGIRRG